MLELTDSAIPFAPLLSIPSSLPSPSSLPPSLLPPSLPPWQIGKSVQTVRLNNNPEVTIGGYFVRPPTRRGRSGLLPVEGRDGEDPPLGVCVRLETFLLFFY